MRIGNLTVLIFVCCSIVLINSVKAQSDYVKVKFEVDGKEVKQKFKVMLYVNDLAIEPMMDEDGFTVPPEVRNSEKVNVRFVAGEYELFFDSVNTSAFNTDWIVGVDNKPFDNDNIASKNPDPFSEDLLGIYYIHFVSKKGLDTRMVVRVYK